MSAFEQLKDKIAYFGGYKWLPYANAEKLVEDIEIKNKHLEMLKKSNREYQQFIDHLEKTIKNASKFLADNSGTYDEPRCLTIGEMTELYDLLVDSIGFNYGDYLFTNSK